LGRKKEDVDLNKDKVEEKMVDEFADELDRVDSDEERIIQDEIKRRREISEKLFDKEQKDEETKKLKPYGLYKEIVESEFLDTMLKNNQCVCHFYSTDFERCKIADKHLEIIAQQHAETLFVKINANKTPFFTDRLGIQVHKIIKI
jgi:hypothetical protein